MIILITYISLIYCEFSIKRYMSDHCNYLGIALNLKKNNWNAHHLKFFLKAMC